MEQDVVQKIQDAAAVHAQLSGVQAQPHAAMPPWSDFDVMVPTVFCLVTSTE